MRKYVGLLVTTGVLVLGLSGLAQSAIIYTPPLTPEAGGSFACSAANVSGRTRQVTIEFISATGAVVESSGPIILPPGEVAAMINDSAVPRYCRVIAHGRKNTIRVSLESRIGGGTVAAVQGQ